ncbi:MAG: hypothetical protein QM820_50795 [Minicystis sp.]
MHPLVRGAAAAAVLTALGSLDRSGPPPPPGSAPVTDVRGVDGLPAPCLPGTLPEGPVCLRIPDEREAGRVRLDADLPRAAAARTGVEVDRIPRRPERNADPAAYLYPIGASRPPRILGGFDARSDLPGVHLAARPGEKVVLVSLDQQDGPAEVVLVGDLFGPTVVTRHEVTEGSRKRSYLLFHGRLDRAEAGLAAGAKLEPGAALGYARTDNGGGLIEIYLEARLIHDGVTLDPKKLTDAGVASPIDVRDVLPLRPR